MRYAEESDTEAVFKRKLLVIKDEYLLMLSQMANETANKQGEELKKVKAKYAETERAISIKSIGFLPRRKPQICRMKILSY